ncbi:MAG: Hint domain-containing protein [Roseovarius sp.]
MRANGAWIGIAEHEGGTFQAGGLGAAPGARQEEILPRGTLMLETHLSPEGRPQTLLNFARGAPWTGGLTLKALPNGGIVLIEQLADDLRHAALPHDLDGRNDEVRVYYSWDAPARWGRLSLEHVAKGRITSVQTPTPHPMTSEDMSMISRFPARRAMDRDVNFLAISSEVEPLGPMPGLTASVPIATPRGLVPAAQLRRGDTVLTSSGAVVPILRTVAQRFPARGALRPVRLRAPFFGLRQDILVAPHQRLVIGGSQVEYMFGTEAALVPVRHLVNGASAYYDTGHAGTCADTITYYDILLPGHEVIIAAGCPMESLYIGRLRRDKPALEASLLAPFERNHLPEHARPIWPVLKPFEAKTLAALRAA